MTENDKISFCADELNDDNISELIDNDKTETNASSTDDTLQQLAEIFDDSKPTGDDIKPHFAPIVEKKGQKKLALEKLKSIQDKRLVNCPSVCSITFNPEIWAKLPFYQQRADQNILNIQEAVRKTNLIAIQTAHALSTSKTNDLEIKKLLSQQADLIAMLGHISHELASVRRNKIKCVLKPEYAPICSDNGERRKFLFGDDLPKRLKEAKKRAQCKSVRQTQSTSINPISLI